jgi:hypothetical protein
MTISESEYFAQRQQKIQRRQRMLTVVSVASFFGSMVFTGISAVQRAIQAPLPENAPIVTLQQEIQGYELILQREPNNQLALEKLSLLRLKQQDRKGAIVLLEKLVKLYPDRQDYKFALEQEKLKAQNSNSK